MGTAHVFNRGSQENVGHAHPTRLPTLSTKPSSISGVGSRRSLDGAELAKRAGSFLGASLLAKGAITSQRAPFASKLAPRHEPLFLFPYMPAERGIMANVPLPVQV